MIGRLTGKLVECSPGSVLLEVGGVGYVLQIPLSTFYPLSRHGRASVTLHVHTHLRDDALVLYGFATADERMAFERFLTVSGVGPRLALAILSGIGVRDLERAVAEGDMERLRRIPGVGRKRAERLMLELRQEVRGARDGHDSGARLSGAGGAAAGGVPIRADATSALVNLGYPFEVADRAVAGTLARLGSAATLERTLRETLAGLIRRPA
jgi:Holliday junction DNA helicase RuvA